MMVWRRREEGVNGGRVEDGIRASHAWVQMMLRAVLKYTRQISCRDEVKKYE